MTGVVLTVLLVATLATITRSLRARPPSPPQALNTLAELSTRPAPAPREAAPLAATGDVAVVAASTAAPAGGQHEQWDCRVEGPTVEHLEAPSATQTPLRGAKGDRWFRAA